MTGGSYDPPTVTSEVLKSAMAAPMCDYCSVLPSARLQRRAARAGRRLGEFARRRADGMCSTRIAESSARPRSKSRTVRAGRDLATSCCIMAPRL